MSYSEYAELEHAEPYVLSLESSAGSLLYFGSRHTTDPSDSQIDSIITLWQGFRPTVALAESRRARRGSMDAGIKTFGESAVPISLANEADIPVYTFEPPLDVEIRSLLPSWTKERLLLFYVLRSYTARAVTRRSDGQARELIRKRGNWPGLEGAIPSLAAFDSIWHVEFPNGTAWRELPWQATWPTGSEPWLNEISAAVNRVRDQYMVALIASLVARGERVFAVQPRCNAGTDVARADESRNTPLSRGRWYELPGSRAACTASRTPAGAAKVTYR
jgi:hypothetical protein